ncbi:uncharacterized protein EI90DRAFT_3117216 [Cantharellus anzutake]|uniref:uncharacterized protein n=1 Tax=Cantharellus anzutake TaxID=1750568 RepID=UPI001903FEB8|nr:uncharacterized protein EI90DRAFT_3117216 [Cantharellus anzutake]KAF8340707.1 hypothetical protein EI90DRAFT_3117216 [Cantharellus anzutake]
MSVDPMFNVSYERQQAQDRETIRSTITGGTPPVAQHQGGSQSRGAAPNGSQVSDSTRYGGMPLPYAAGTDGYPTGPTAVPASGGPAPPHLPWSLVGPTRNAAIPHTQLGLVAFTLEDGWVHNSIESPARPISVGTRFARV